jgi:uncharacterized membrane protein
MNTSNTRTVIAYLIIGTYVCLTIIAVVYPVLDISLFDMEKFSAYFSKVSGALTGLVGVIIGYYFGKSENNNSGTSDSQTLNGGPTPPAGTAPGGTTTPKTTVPGTTLPGGAIPPAPVPPATPVPVTTVPGNDDSSVIANSQIKVKSSFKSPFDTGTVQPEPEKANI